MNINKNSMKINHKRFIPDRVEQLSNCEIFVFGSNLEGMHMGGAARIAHEKFGAEWGVGDGPTGRCYAIPTMHGRLEDIRREIHCLCKGTSNEPFPAHTRRMRNCRI